MTSSRNDGKPVLSLNKVSKSFGGVVAAKNIDLDFFGGEILGLIGPNGAGKTTLVNLITGIYAVDSGAITFKGRDVTRKPTYQRARMGIARTFQHPRLLARCSLYDNIMLGADLARKAGRETTRDVRAEMADLLSLCGMADARLDGMISQLPYGQQKLLEIIRAILSEPDVLLLDEPAAGLNSSETGYIVSLMDVAVKQGIAVLLIEHSMDLVMSVCDRLTVLNFGHQIANGTPAEIRENQAVITAYLGSAKL
ncbi:MAG TPA: ABC transporter ATP-binding protein [Candidatus Limnocylindria bacterium]|nr:ABC transporter ATP-binding protein [Candidatus Limnocylindria bacterium]